MIDPEAFLRALATHGVTFFAGVPDSLLADFCACVAERSPGEHLIAANEGGAVAAAIGHHLATGRTALVYMQNSGLGNAINPLLSLADPAVYAVPMLLLIGWRGEPGTRDEPQHAAQGRMTLPLLQAMELPCTVLDAGTTDLERSAGEAVASAQRRAGPHALLVRRGAFAAFRPRATPAAAPASGGLGRAQAIARIADGLGDTDLVVATTGMISRELYAERAHRGQGHERDFLVVGGMGHASQIALALAEQQPARQVYCLDGDGAVLMHLGALAIIGARRPPKLRHVVLNNGAHESVGGQPTVALGLDLPALARAVGYASALRVAAPEELESGLRELRRADGPALLEIRVALGHERGLGRPAIAPLDAGRALMASLR